MARSRAGGGRRGGVGGMAGRAQSGVPAVLKFRNRQISTYRGTVADAFGDLDDTGVPYLTGIPAAIAETTDVVFDQATQRPQNVRSITCVVPAWADIETTDTIQDPATGYFYLIESIQAKPGIGYFPAEKTLSLRMRSGVSIASD
jgi:hypothetical protein